MKGVGAMYQIETWLLPCFASSAAKFRQQYRMLSEIQMSGKLLLTYI